MNSTASATNYITRELATVTEMKDTYELLKQLGYDYDLDTYMNYLEDMIPKGYKQMVVLENDRYIGVAGFWLSTKLFCGPYVELDNVVVAASHRSKGIGHLLCNVVEEKARQYGCNIAVLDAYVHNERAHQFYFREGYIIRGFHFLKKLA
ncbi:MAG: GNAT family N-acetyltransferase [Bacteroidota bacterium]|nr:GNAT family N-acetyltransferase [Bacteroidota bacterium]